MPPPSEPQQQTTPGRMRAGCATLCCILLAVLFFVGSTAFIVWLNVHSHRPRFTVAALSISGGQVAFNLSDTNPNRHIDISYGDATRVSLLFYGEIVASGPVFARDGWYQPRMNTTSIAGVLDVVDEPSFSVTLRAGHGHLPLRLKFAMAMTFFDVFPSAEQIMHVMCDLLIGADGSLRRESVGAPCNSYFLPLLDEDN
ncbi:unnamed protein product [Alopecurus aequalis]